MLSDAQWDRVQAALPSRRGEGEEAARSKRTFLEAVLWVGHTGASWRSLPLALGNWHAVLTRFNRWNQTGIWVRLIEMGEPDISEILQKLQERTMAGRKPLPTVIKQLRGTLRKHRVNPNEPKPQGRLSEPPEYMAERAKEAWRHAVSNAPPGLFSVLDAAVLERWANCIALYQETAAKISRHGMNAMLTKTPEGLWRRSALRGLMRDLANEMKGYETEMGFTPAARGRVSAYQDTTSEPDLWEEVIGG